MQRPDSPSDNNHLNSQHQLGFKSTFHNSETLFNLHSAQNNSQGLYNNNVHTASDYTSDHDGQKQATKMSNSFAPSFRASAPFNSFPNQTRPRHPPSAPNQYREQSANFSNSYPTAADVFATNNLSHLTSPTQQHQLAANPYETLHQGRGFEYGGSQSTTGFGAHSKQPYIVDPFGSVPPSSMLQTHQAGNGKSAHTMQTHQQQHNVYSAPQSSYTNGPQIHSQTPYGPHLQTNGPNSAQATVPVVNHVNGVAINPAQEEISTIFVVGFPDDMQEREFQNMFTFSTGFEAATLKIPNKEYTAYGGAGASVASGSIRQNYNQSFVGSNDPYNLVTVNQGGVVVDGGRDGTMTSWPTSVPGIPQDDIGGHFIPGAGGSVQSMPPRKQIIGFAKFRSRADALEARDILQGKRVDVEKGAVLKAEMAKKNLHTKRGVGPLQLPSMINGGTNGAALGGVSESGLAVNGLMGSLSGTLSSSGAFAGDSMTLRDRELGTIGLWKEPRIDGNATRGEDDDRERERRRDREAGVINAMGLAGSRGPRERAEEDERERERRRKEKEARLRNNNLTAFDAFHSVPPQIISRHASNSLLSPTLESATATTPLSGNGSSGQAFTRQDDLDLGEVGPWDAGNLNGSRKLSVPMTGLPVRSASAHRSPSPNPQAEVPKFSPPSNDTTSTSSQSSQLPRSYSPALEQQQQQHYALSNHSQQQISSASSASSVGGGSQSDAAADPEGPRGALAVSTNHGNTSPQLPSPASGASSTSTRNVVDQNPPINTLYVGNLPTSQVPSGYPPNYLEESLRELFSRRPGFRKLCFRQKSNGPMCFVEFEDVSFATKTLSDLYGNTLNGLIKGGGIRLSYSKNPLGVRTPTSAGSNGPSLQQQQLQNNSQQLGGASPFPPDAFQPRQAEPFQPRQLESFQPREMFQPRQSVDVDANRATSLRRDATSPPASSNYMMTSPPPRFFSPTPATNTFSTPLPGLTYPRYNVFGGYNNTTITAFSPFGGIHQPHSEMVSEQNGVNPHEIHYMHHRDLSTTVNNIEAARAS
jgi:RNA recognition motif-containing protein